MVVTVTSAASAQRPRLSTSPVASDAPEYYSRPREPACSPPPILNADASGSRPPTNPDDTRCALIAHIVPSCATPAFALIAALARSHVAQRPGRCRRQGSLRGRRRRARRMVRDVM